MPRHKLLPFVVPEKACQLGVTAEPQLGVFLGDVPKNQVSGLEAEEEFVGITRVFFYLTDFARTGTTTQLDCLILLINKGMKKWGTWFDNLC